MRTARPLSPTGATRPSIGEVRNPWMEWGLTLVTLGIYAAVRHYRVNRELRDFGVEVDPLKALFAFVPGGLVLVPLLITVHRTAQRVAVAQETSGLAPSIRPELSVVCSIFAWLHVPYEQAELNRAWDAEAAQSIPIAPSVNPSPPQEDQ